MFAPELIGAPDPGVLLDALDVATSWETWDADLPTETRPRDDRRGGHFLQENRGPELGGVVAEFVAGT